MDIGLNSGSEMWRALGASVAGPRHQAAGECQDVHACVLGERGAVIIVADGAGSAPQALKGAELVVASAEELAVELLAAADRDNEPHLRALLRRVLVSAREALDAAADKATATNTAVRLGEFATTLTVAVAGACLFGAVQIGDGSVVLQRRDGELQLAAYPNEQEYVNEPILLTTDRYLDFAQIRIEAADGIAAIVVMTDGVGLLAFDARTGTPYRPFFQPLLDFAQQDNASQNDLRAFLAADRVCERTDDDKTIVLAIRKAAEA